MIPSLGVPILVADVVLRTLTGHVDAEFLGSYADSLDIPRPVVWAVAWQESRTGARGNAYLGPGRVDTIWRNDTLYIVRRCRELGRMQINPCTWASSDPRCTLVRIKKNYRDNVYCGLLKLSDLYRIYGSWPVAVERYNGRGWRARSYRQRVEHYVGRITMLSY